MCLTQIVVRAEDRSPLPKSASTNVTVTVIRNEFAPRFLNTPFIGEDLYAAGLGETILSVSAVDDDVYNPFNRDVSIYFTS